jgi:hypothetical protein
MILIRVVFISTMMSWIPGILIGGLFAQPADVVRVEASGQDQEYTFSVTIESLDTGCEQYANWWEVISPEGKLIYRRILRHSHVGEQPFTRSGGPVRISENLEVIVRAHMNNSGYGGKAMKGNITGGFTEVSMPAGYAASLEEEEPLPEGCDF